MFTPPVSEPGVTKHHSSVFFLSHLPVCTRPRARHRSAKASLHPTRRTQATCIVHGCSTATCRLQTAMVSIMRGHSLRLARPKSLRQFGTLPNTRLQQAWRKRRSIKRCLRAFRTRRGHGTGGYRCNHGISRCSSSVHVLFLHSEPNMMHWYSLPIQRCYYVEERRSVAEPTRESLRLVSLAVRRFLGRKR